ncbi:hypothetical protein [Massilia sp. SYSU DXS3249]
MPELNAGPGTTMIEPGPAGSHPVFSLPVPGRRQRVPDAMLAPMRAAPRPLRPLR